jgi:hypothetical protein
MTLGRMDIVDIRWVGAFCHELHLFGTGGRRLALPPPAAQSWKTKPLKQAVKILLQLSIRHAKEGADNTLESKLKVKLPLSQGATIKRVPALFGGLLLLAPLGIIAFLLIATIIPGKPHAHYDFYGALLIFALMILSAPGLFCLWLFVRGVKFFVSSYRVANETFSPVGFRRGNEERIPYRRLEIILYRGLGRLDDLCAGLVEVRVFGRQPIHFGPERENYFILPYVLNKWAGGKFKVRPIGAAPQNLAKMVYRTSIWFSPTHFRNVTVRRQS